MSISVQARRNRFQLRVKHRLLPRPFFFTFETEAEARDYDVKLHVLLQRGVVPAELLAREKAPEDPLTAEVVRDHLRNAANLTPSNDRLLGNMLAELSLLRLSSVTYAWFEGYVSDLKLERNLLLTPAAAVRRFASRALLLTWTR